MLRNTFQSVGLGLSLALGTLFITCFQSAFASEVPRGPGQVVLLGGEAFTSALVQEILEESGIQEGGYALVLTTQGTLAEELEKGAQQVMEERNMPAEKIRHYHLMQGPINTQQLDSIRNAQLLIFLSQDQNDFMEQVGSSEIPRAIRDAYRGGATVVGAGPEAVLMGAKMMVENNAATAPGLDPLMETGHPVAPGLNLLQHSIIVTNCLADKQLNKMLALSLSQPDKDCIGLSKGAAMIVNGNRFRVLGKGQVIVMRNMDGDNEIKGGLMGGEDVRMEILLPGDKGVVKLQ